MTVHKVMIILNSTPIQVFSNFQQVLVIEHEIHLEYPSKHDIPPQCWLNVGPASQTMVQHWANIVSVHSVDLDLGATSVTMTRTNAVKMIFEKIGPFLANFARQPEEKLVVFRA